MSTCRDVESSVGRPLATLSEAERLHLEQHLSACAACRHESALSRVVGELIRSAPSNLTEGARERALSGAFERAAKAVPAPRTDSRGSRVGLSVAAAAVLLLGSSVLLMDSKSSDELARATPTGLATKPEPRASVEPAPRAVAQEAATQQTNKVAAEPADEGWIESTSVETRTFAGARVTLARGTRLHFERAANTLELARGEVTLDVEHQHDRPFAVLTQGFRVEVLGTQFVVSPEHVAVLRGHVQVRDRESHRLLSDLHAGQSYRPKNVHEAARAADASELIRQARAALGSGDVAAARALMTRARAVARRVSDRAEVLTLDAECELLARRPAQAIAAYLRVADRYASLRAGENALFAAAQLSLRERDAASARTLFERYLTRYPSGRFVDEARAHLQTAR